MTWHSVVAFAVYAVGSLALTLLVDSVVTTPYMDEPFHIPQAQTYCRGDWHSWDPKITTPPGLYLVSNAVFRLLAPLTSLIFGSTTGATGATAVEVLCTKRGLRLTNWMLGCGLFWVLRRLLIILYRRDGITGARIAVETLVLSLFPISFFFVPLYYTDTGSTLFVLWMYALTLQRRYLAASVIGGVSLLFRQTNVVWTGMAMAIAVVDVVARRCGDAETRRVLYGMAASSLANGRFVNALTNLIVVLASTSGFLCVIAAFAWFIVWNGGIVLGDKSNHVAAIHLPQLFYFVSFACGIGLPYLLTLDRIAEFLDIVVGIVRRPLSLACASAVAFLAATMYAIRDFTIEHPFLLSDNRHYTFYLWKNIYRRHPLVKFAVIPFYVFAGWLFWRSLGARRTIMWCIIFGACTAAVLVPSPLLEFRYFLVPMFMFRLHIAPPSAWRLIAEGLLYAAINAVTFWMFLKRPFEWASEPGALQRFMW
ncbi:hypothetical protein GQ42DRAFT_144905 [Ramicandelaber brevisporus]|nr:hypothetical protein GQ42DRAFT_144905 [Ramicandelaber brevisporus]